MEEAGIRTVIDLTDDAEEARAYDMLPGPDGEGLRIFARTFLMDAAQEEFRTDLAAALRFLIANDGPYLVHCLEGKDRTGFVCALLECLAGASLDEACEDYMKTYENFYRVQRDSTQYAHIRTGNLEAILRRAFAVEDPASADLAACARVYLVSGGMTDAEIDALTARLAGK